MAIYLIDKIKPKNNGTFPMVDAEDVLMPDGTRLSELDLSTGRDGENGLTPYIGSNGNWWIGETDTGVRAQGKDGVSTSVTVTAITGGHRVTITDASGAKTFDVTDGEDGHTPIKGTDYYTEADKQEMVSAVLAALPAWVGGEY